MQLVTLDDRHGGTPGARLQSGEHLNLARSAQAGTVETWLPDNLIAILAGGTQALAVVRGMVTRAEAADPVTREQMRASGCLLPADSRLLAPIPKPGLVLAAGLAYRSHLAEMSGTPAPANPTAFLKSPHSVSAPGATVMLPPQAPDHVDFEGELAIIFGSTCHNVASETAMSHVAGITIANDLSARDWVKAVWAATQPWEARQTWEVNLMGKSMPDFTPLGPVLTTLDDIADIGALRLVTRLNGAVMQDAPISDMIFPIADVIAYFSRWYTFEPGDVLLSGTPAGVGVGRKPPVFVKPGDTVEVEIDRIGILSTHFSA